LRLLVIGLFFGGADFSQNFFAVVGDLDIGPELDDLAVGGDEEGLAASELDWTHALDGDAILVDDLVFRVREELEGQALLCAEALVAVRGVEADAQHGGVECGVFVEVTLKVVGLDGAAGGLVLGVEVENDPFAFVVGEANGGIVLRRQGKAGSAGAHRDGVSGRSGMRLDGQASRDDHS
jgi:hypothetical protein